MLVRDIEPQQDLSAKLTLIAEAPGVHIAEQGPIPPYDPVVTAAADPAGAGGARHPLRRAGDAGHAVAHADRPGDLHAAADRHRRRDDPRALPARRHQRRLADGDGAGGDGERASPSSACSPARPTTSGCSTTHPNYFASPVTAINSYYVIGRVGAAGRPAEPDARRSSAARRCCAGTWRPISTCSSAAGSCSATRRTWTRRCGRTRPRWRAPSPATRRTSTCR